MRIFESYGFKTLLASTRQGKLLLFLLLIPYKIELLSTFEKNAGIWIAQLMNECALSTSSSEALRLIKQGGVKINGERLTDTKLNLEAGEYVIQAGKRKFARILIK